MKLSLKASVLFTRLQIRRKREKLNVRNHIIEISWARTSLLFCSRTELCSYIKAAVEWCHLASLLSFTLQGLIYHLRNTCKNTSSAVRLCMGKVLWDLLVRFFVSVSMQYIATQILFTFQCFSAVLHRRRKHLLFHPESCCVFISVSIVWICSCF